ncbi:P-loop containing nucleoside triphosphate hydrolase protein [Trichoderma ceciliae]
MQRPEPHQLEIANNQFGNNVSLQQGNNTINHYYPPRQPPQPVIRVIPYPHNEELVNRPDLVDKINSLLPQTSTTYHSAALWGLGGSGKTQIALNYAYQRCADASCSVFWVHADSEATFSQDYKTIARKLGIDEGLKGEDLFAAVRDHISILSKWVLVLDNADDLKLFGIGQASEQVQGLFQYIPHAPTGTVLWTTRDAHITGTLVGSGRAIEVARMRSNEAEELLMIARSVKTNTEEAEISALLEELRWLPLAIIQAGAYIRRTSISVKEYLSLLAQSKKRWDILKVNEFDRHRRPNIPNNVLETWAISIDRIRQESEIAYKILHVIAYVSNENIPHKIITATLNRTEKTINERSEELESEATKAITRLKEFSFIGVRHMEDGRRNYEMHKLVQEATRYGLTASKRYILKASEAWTGQYKVGRDLNSLAESYSDGEDMQSEGYFSSIALQAIADLFPVSEQKTWTQCEKYLAHAVQIGEWADLNEKQTETARLFSRVSRFLYDRGRWREKQLVDERALELRQKVLGTEHPDTITAMESLASTYYSQGWYSKAEPLKVQVLNLRKEVLGDKHPDTIEAIGNLASTYYSQGWYSKAEPLEVQVLNLQKEVLGDKHPHTIKAIGNLASTYYSQGQYSKAEPLEVQVLNLQKEVLGDKHPDTIRAMHSLAYSWYSQGRHHDAIALMQQCLQYRRSVLGPDHPDTMESVKALEQWHQTANFLQKVLCRIFKR